MRPASGTAPGNPKPPARSSGVKPRGNCSNASGFPRVSAMIRSATRASSGPASADASNARASSTLSPPSSIYGQPRQLRTQLPAPRIPALPDPPPPASREARALRRRLIQPLLVIDQADQRLFACHTRQQVEDGEPHKEPVRRRPRHRRPQCDPLTRPGLAAARALRVLPQRL